MEQVSSPRRDGECFGEVLHSGARRPQHRAVHAVKRTAPISAGSPMGGLEQRSQHILAVAAVARAGVRVGKMLPAARKRLLRRVRAVEGAEARASPVGLGDAETAASATARGGTSTAALAPAREVLSSASELEPVKLQSIAGIVRIVSMEGIPIEARLCAQVSSSKGHDDR
mmetsp:Transcript_118433/g.340058  ORF Transcript_118433/g.340058 Transcript_118433/m.340058 type:complete len:171 (+) Transcript_118433:73-585(+)